jgi:hypothetical protein
MSRYEHLSEFLIEIHLDGKHKGDDVADMTPPRMRYQPEFDEAVCCAVCTLTKMTPETWKQLSPPERIPWLEAAIDAAQTPPPDLRRLVSSRDIDASCLALAGRPVSESANMPKTPSDREIRAVRDAVRLWFRDPLPTDLPSDEASVVAFRRDTLVKYGIEIADCAKIAEYGTKVADYADSRGIDAAPLREFLRNWIANDAGAALLRVLEDVKQYNAVRFKAEDDIADTLKAALVGVKALCDLAVNARSADASAEARLRESAEKCDQALMHALNTLFDTNNQVLDQWTSLDTWNALIKFYEMRQRPQSDSTLWFTIWTRLRRILQAWTQRDDIGHFQAEVKANLSHLRGESDPVPQLLALAGGTEEEDEVASAEQGQSPEGTPSANNAGAGNDGGENLTADQRDRIIGQLPKRVRKAYRSYEYSATMKGKKLDELKDGDAYDFLTSEGLPEENSAWSDLADYQLPNRATWLRYVGSGRDALNEQKNRPRRARQRGNSVVRQDEIELRESGE